MFHLARYFFQLATCFLFLNNTALCQTTSSIQFSKLDSVINRMYFNIPDYKPDSSVLWFIKKYYPGFSRPPVPHGWTVYPNEKKDIPVLYSTVHTFTFTRHPFFDAKFIQGR